MKNELIPAGAPVEPKPVAQEQNRRGSQGLSRRDFFLGRSREAKTIGAVAALSAFLAGCGVSEKNVASWGGELGKAGANLLIEFGKGVGGKIMEEFREDPESLMETAEALSKLAKNSAPAQRALRDFEYYDANPATNIILGRSTPGLAPQEIPAKRRSARVEISSDAGWSRPIATPTSAWKFDSFTDHLPDMAVRMRVRFKNWASYANPVDQWVEFEDRPRKLIHLPKSKVNIVDEQGNILQRDVIFGETPACRGFMRWLNGQRPNRDIPQGNAEYGNKNPVVWPAEVSYKNTPQLAALGRTGQGPILRYNEKPDKIGWLFDEEYQAAGLTPEEIAKLRDPRVRDMEMRFAAVAAKSFTDAARKRLGEKRDMGSRPKKDTRLP